MVLHGKTVYPGKVLDRKVDSMVYLVQYDGLSASRSEWREHAEVISIDEVRPCHVTHLKLLDPPYRWVCACVCV
jgi:hypothetical protein